MSKRTLYLHYSTLFVFCQVLAFLPLSEAVFATENYPLSENKRGAISVGCETIKNSLKSLQRSDSALRVHLGTTYQSILSNYLTPMNLRLVKNNQLTDNLNYLLSDFNTKRNAFNQQFITYSRQLEELTNIDCKNDPDKFYQNLVKTRAERAKVAKAVNELNQILKSHIRAVKELNRV